MENTVLPKTHTLFVDDRKKIVVTGVTDTYHFDEETLLFDTPSGRVEIKGENLQVTKLSIEAGELEVEGTVSSVSYFASPGKAGGLFRKVFS